MIPSGVGTPPRNTRNRGEAPLLGGPKHCEFNLRQYISSRYIFFFNTTPKTSFVTKHFFFCWTITIHGQMIKSGELWTGVNCLGLRLILLKKFCFRWSGSLMRGPRLQPSPPLSSLLWFKQLTFDNIPNGKFRISHISYSKCKKNNVSDACNRSRKREPKYF